MKPLSCISPCTAGGAEGLSGVSMFLGLTRILFTLAHTSGSPDWTGTRRPVPFRWTTNSDGWFRLAAIGGP